MTTQKKVGVVGGRTGKSEILEILKAEGYEIVHIDSEDREGLRGLEFDVVYIDEYVIRKNPDPPKIACGFGVRTGARRAQRNGKPWERR
jgi:phage terminase large subunit-like protein